jgi:hypothetical protein
VFSLKPTKQTHTPPSQIRNTSGGGDDGGGREGRGREDIDVTPQASSSNNILKKPSSPGSLSARSPHSPTTPSSVKDNLFNISPSSVTKTSNNNLDNQDFLSGIDLDVYGEIDKDEIDRIISNQ